jgi:LETM1 and EF-hand domain-containing protein 1, mitochondrial
MLLRNSTRGFRYTPRSFPRELPAIAILLPRRNLATETSTSTGGGGGGNYPPPGFNAEQAKKPLPQEQQKKTQPEKSAESKDQKEDSIESIAIPRNGPTAHPKGTAEEKQALKEIAAEEAALQKSEEAKATSPKKEEKKLTIWEKVKKEATHYWDGTKLLVTEVKISSKLALKMAAGYELTRRENRQV